MYHTVAQFLVFKYIDKLINKLKGNYLINLISNASAQLQVNIPWIGAYLYTIKILSEVVVGPMVFICILLRDYLSQFGQLQDIQESK